MRVEIIDTVSPKMPDVGEYFIHKGCREVWRRLATRTGCITVQVADDCFPSYNVETGEIRHTSKCAGDLIIVEPINEATFTPSTNKV